MSGRGIVLAVMVGGLGIGTGGVGAQVPDSVAVRAAEQFIGQLRAHDWASAEAMVTPALRSRLGAAQLETVWSQIGGSLGALTGVRQRGVTAVDTMWSVELYGDFASDTMVLRVVISPAREVVGFWIGPVPQPSPAPSEGPPYADPSAFREAEVRVGAEPWLLPGTLTLPAGGGRHPVVVLVHGSGPHDRDETVGGVRVFRDLAWGLAARGIGVLRYEKRTKTHGAKMAAGVTLESEVIEDALAALELARSNPSVDAGRVYVLGHSLGAQLAPEIARRDARLAGVIMLAAPARPIAEVMTEQLRYLATLPQNAAPEAQQQIRAALEQIDRLARGAAPDTAVILGAPVSYFRQLDAMDARAIASRLDVPLLVLQGERDYQVTMKDFALWQMALGNRETVRLRSFPGLNHLFVSGTGPATPVEYMQPGFVAADVVAEIAGWIGRR